MATIRPLGRSDLPAVAGLMSRRLPGWNQDEAFLAETLIDQRWATPELPSLVAVTGDEDVVGFIGSQPRALRLDDRRLRGVCCSHLVVSDDGRAGAAGALLLRRLLSGPQDLTWTDTATEGVTRIWKSFGGHVHHARACDWMVVVRPARWARELGSAKLRGRDARALAPARGLPIHALAPRSLSPPADVRDEEATASAIAGELEALTRGVRLRVDHDEGSLRDLFAQLESMGEQLVARLVRRRDAAIGCYAYLLRPGRAARALCLWAPSRDADAVFAAMLADARGRGRSVVTGRYEPLLRETLVRRSATLGLARCPLVHSQDPELLALLGTEASLLTDLDGEWFAA